MSNEHEYRQPDKIHPADALSTFSGKPATVSFSISELRVNGVQCPAPERSPMESAAADMSRSAGVLAVAIRRDDESTVAVAGSVMLESDVVGMLGTAGSFAVLVSRMFYESGVEQARVHFGQESTAHCLRRDGIAITAVLPTGHPAAKSILRALRRAVVRMSKAVPAGWTAATESDRR